MTVITTRIRVAEDGTFSGRVPERVPAGEHEVVITVASAKPGKLFTMENFPIHDGPWDDSISLRREHMYGDDGR